MLRLVMQRAARPVTWRPVLAASFSSDAARRGEGMDRWLDDHKELKGLFSKYKDANSKEAKINTARHIIRFTTIHQSAEDRTLYAEFGRVIPREEGGKTLQSHAQLVDEVGRLMMDWLENHDDPRNDVEWRLFDKTARHLIAMVEDHIKDEEEVGLGYLRKYLSSEDLDKLDRDYDEAKASAPTHPHPRGPSSPFASKIMHPLTGAMDRAGDRLKEAVTGDDAADVGDVAERARDRARETAEQAREKAREMADRASDSTRETTEWAKQKASETADWTREKTRETAEQARDRTRDTADWMGDMAKQGGDEANARARDVADRVREAGDRAGDATRDTGERVRRSATGEDYDDRPAGSRSDDRWGQRTPTGGYGP